jgi:hypothetical protein
VFDDEASAGAFHAQIEGRFAGDALVFADPGDLANSGYAATRTAHNGVYVVLTLVVSESDSEDAIVAAQEHAHARHAQSVAYCYWR